MDSSSTTSSQFHFLVAIVVVPLFFLGVVLFLAPKLPSLQTAQTSPTACDLDAKLCPDGSSVGRTGPACEFAECPTSPSTISDISSDWKTYENQQGKFKFSYPLTWNLAISDEKSSENLMVVSLGTPGNPQSGNLPTSYGASFGVYVHPTNLSLNTYINNWVKKDFAESPPVKIGDLVIDSEPAIKFTSHFLISNTHLLFKHNNAVYEIFYNIGPQEINLHQSVIDQIISTFKFTDNQCPPGEVINQCKLGPCCCPVGAECD